MSEIDWPTELRKIEREFDGLPAEPTPTDLRAQFEEERLLVERYGPRATAGAWVRLLLVAALGAALYVWPYPRACGAGLFTFGGAASVVVLGGAWAAVAAWCRRAARAHVLSLVVMAGGGALVAMEVLPRVGDARVDPANPPQLWCVARPAASPAAPPAAEPSPP